jgi:uncharacterized small protein (DUF1192 family)
MRMKNGYCEPELGDKCPSCGVGTFHLPEPENCSCYLKSPCTACKDNKMECNVCSVTTSELIEEGFLHSASACEERINQLSDELEKTKAENLLLKAHHSE